MLTSSIPKPHRIREVRVSGLFGLYNYRLRPGKESGPSHLFILYGENGSGKTTVLQMIARLLAPEPAKGHRGFLGQIRFKSFEVVLSDGTLVSATRSESTKGPYALRITFPTGENVDHQYDPQLAQVTADDPGRSSKYAQSNLVFCAALERIGIGFHYLSHDRKTESREENDELTFMMTAEGQRLVRSKARVTQPEDVLIAPIKAMTDWARTQAFNALNTGSIRANDIYSELIERIANFGEAPPSGPDGGVAALVETLQTLARRNAEFELFGLSSPLAVDELQRVLAKIRTAQQPLVLHILEPYVGGMVARLNALDGLRTILDRFVSHLNDFYHGKNIAFDLRAGLSIKSDTGDPLEPSQLSSGEKQLLLIMCSALSVRDSVSIVVIDEPEISLNVKWQRKLLHALLDCTEGSSTQFLIATHSLELLSQNLDCVARLDHVPEPA